MGVSVSRKPHVEDEWREVGVQYCVCRAEELRADYGT